MDQIHNEIKKEIILDEDGVHIATVHGEMNIDILANFFMKTPIRTVKKDTKDYT